MGPGDSANPATSNRPQFIEFLEQYRLCGGGKRQTHTSMLDPIGAFHVPDGAMGSFWKLYQRAVKQGAALHLTESHLEQGPIVIDIDLKYTRDASLPERVYTYDDVQAVLRLYNAAILKFLDVPADEFVAYVMEKERPLVAYEDDSTRSYKDGLHIVYPEICASTSLQLLLRELVVAQLKHSNTLGHLRLDNALEDVFDKAVIQRNNWMLYGSQKNQDDSQRYRLTCVWNYDFEQQPLDEVDFFNLPKYLSVKKFPNPDQHTPFQPGTTQDQIEKLLQELTRRARPGGSKTVCGTMIDVRRARGLVALLHPRRADDYTSWIELGWCLHNIDDGLLDAWVEFSRQSRKFREGECEKVWDACREEGLGIGSLHRWARQDNPAEYADFMLNEHEGMLKESLKGTSGLVARAFWELHRYHYVCASIRHKKWFEFRDHRWREMDEATGILRKLNDEFSNAYIRLGIMYSNKAMTLEGEEKQRWLKQHEMASKVSMRLCTYGFKREVISELMHMYYDCTFLTRLDENPYLLGFENGVYDLKTQMFRDGRPEDCLSLSTKLNYVPYDPRDATVQKVEGLFRDVHPDDSLREYMLRLMASFLTGLNRDQRFHIWTGSGSNGKSLFLKLYQNCLGDYATTISTTLLTNKRANSNAATPELAKTKGRRFVSFHEPENDDSIQVGNMKSLTGGDPIMARALYSDPIEFVPQFKTILACNKLPNIPSNDGGTWRRIRVLPFEMKFVDNPTKPNERKINRALGEEIDGWREAFMGLLIHKFDLYSKHGIVEPPKVLEHTLEYQRLSDMYQEFIGDQLVITGDDKDYVDVNDMYGTFKQWAKDAHTNRKVTRAEMKMDLEEKVGKLRKNKFRGVRIRMAEDDDESDDEEENAGPGTPTLSLCE